LSRSPITRAGAAGEILNLTWAQVDLANRTVRLNPGETKNKKGRVIVLEGERLATVKAQWEKRKVATLPGQSPTPLCPYVFHRNGRRISDPRKAWQKACATTGLGNKLLHDFRRTAVRDMVRADVPEKVAMTISGHKTRSVFDRYDIVDEEDLRQAALRHAEHVQNQAQTAKVAAVKRA
jgi:integrase